MKLYFERSSGEKILVGEYETKKQAYEGMNNFIHEKNPNYIIHYVREWRAEDNDECTVMDVGSHTEFFLLYD